MQEWQLHEKHELEVRQILREDGCMDFKGQLRAWHGKRTDAKLEQAGHDDLSFLGCKCRKQAENKL